MDRKKQCEPCKCRGISIQAVKMCFPCQEQYCKECSEVHKNSRLTRSHTLLDTDKIYGPSTPSSLDVISLLKNQTCEAHTEKPMEFYCGAHKLLFCSRCVFTHILCIDVVDIELSGRVLIQNKVTDEIENDLKKVSIFAKGVLSKYDENIKLSKQKAADIVSELKSMRDKLVAMFDRQIAHCNEILSGEIKNEETGGEKVKQVLENDISYAEKYDNALKTFVSVGHSSDIFRCVLMIQNQTDELRADIENISTSAKLDEIKILEKSELLLKLLENNELLIQVSEKFTDISSARSFSLQTNAKKEFEKLFTKSNGIKPRQNVNIHEEKLTCESTIIDDEQNNQLGHKLQSMPTDRQDNSIHITDEIMIKQITSQSNIGTANQALAKQDIEKSIKKKKRSKKKKVPLIKFQTVSTQTSNPVDPLSTHRIPNLYEQMFHRRYNIEITYLHSFKSPTSGENNAPWFNGIVCLPVEILILSDLNNSCLRVMESDGTSIQVVPLSYDPGCLALVNDNNALAVCLMKTNLILLMEVSENRLSGRVYLQTLYHPKCVVEIDDKRLLVSSRDEGGRWHLEIVSVITQASEDIYTYGIQDGSIIAIQPLPEEPDNYNIVKCSDDSGELTCFTKEGDILFKYDVNQANFVISDHRGYVFIIRYPGEIQVLSPKGDFICKLRRFHLYGAKFATFNETKNKLYIICKNNSSIHVLDIVRKEI